MANFVIFILLVDRTTETEINPTAINVQIVNLLGNSKFIASALNTGSINGENDLNCTENIPMEYLRNK